MTPRRSEIQKNSDNSGYTLQAITDVNNLPVATYQNTWNQVYSGSAVQRLGSTVFLYFPSKHLWALGGRVLPYCLHPFFLGGKTIGGRSAGLEPATLLPLQRRPNPPL